ncbi:MAG: polysaccharide biosynthesis protein [Clostridia bacterium]|nr:polysaccharide biosynthesis protein [Clostridia bacterium]
MKRWKRFASGAGMLAVLGVIGKVIGMFYRLPLTNILGAEGMGLYQLIFPLYSLILAVGCGGMPAAISKYISELTASGDTALAKRALKITIVGLSVFGVFAALALFLLRDGIAALQGNPKTALSYAAIAPAVFFSGLIACYRGYFQGMHNMFPSGISQIIEQIVKVALGLIFAALFVGNGVEYGVMGAILGVSLSEAVALMYLALRFTFVVEKQQEGTLQAEAAADVAVMPKTVRTAQILRSIYTVALPVTLGSLVLPFSQVLDSFLVVNLLEARGMAEVNATALYGVFNGPVGSLLNMPTVITISLAASLLPRIAACNRNHTCVDGVVDKSVATYLLTIIPCTVVFVFAPKPILSLLYSRGLTDSEIAVASKILHIEGVNLLFLGGIQLTSAMMQGVGKARTPVFNLLIGASIKVAATAGLIPIMGIYGAAVANVLFYTITFFLDFVCATKLFGKFFYFKKQAKSLFCVFGFAAVFSLYFVLRLYVSDLVALLTAGVAAAATLLILVLKTKCILLN